MKNCLNLKLNKVSLVAALLISSLGYGQFSPSKEIPLRPIEDDQPYLFPINPGKQNWLAGTMGELRNTHFHSGIDIRTDNQIGIPVLATQRGYISRVIVGTNGYGQALFVTHPDGNVSVYGHLDRYYRNLAAYVLTKHYQLKSFDLDIEFYPNQFMVNRGDTIAFSGNTGGSSGPHLHFEIRDNQNEALNPLTFNFDEIKDVLPPVPQKIAFKTLAIDSRIEDQFGRKEFYLVRNGNSYSIPQPIHASGKIGLELLAFDRLDLSRFRCGINEIEVLLDSQKIFSQKIDKINFNESRGIVSLMDFETLKTRGLRFNKLYVGDGNPLKYYEVSKNKGEIYVADKAVSVQINLIDTYNNRSEVHFKIEPSANTALKSSASTTQPVDYSIAGNILDLKVACAAKEIKIFEKGVPITINPVYQTGGHQVYLVDLQRTIPDSAQTCQGILRFDVKDKIPSGIDYTFYSDWANIRFEPNSLYDTLFINLSNKNKSGKEVFSIGKITDPLNAPIKVTLKMQEKIKPDPKLAVYHLEGKANEYLGGEWQNGNMKFKTMQLGDFILLKDSIAPVIHRLHCYSSSARFRVTDNLSGVAQFSATVDGEWLLMAYDYKTGILQSERLDKSKPIQGDFELTITDRSGNQSIYKQKIL